MSQALTISGSTYTVQGTVRNQSNNEGIVDLRVFVYDNDTLKVFGHDLLRDDLLGIAVTDGTGAFSVSFDSSKFGVFERKPDLYFIVQDAGLPLLDTKKSGDVIDNADESMDPINFVVDLSKSKLRDEIHKDPTDGWVGGFAQSNPDFAYPNPDSAYPTPNLSSLEMKGNMENIGLLKRQQKVLWPEFSWNTEPDETDKKRCYQMFAPDISRLGYTDEGRVYSIICPQQGVSLGKLGNMNVEVTVTGNRGWANESNRELAADMSVVGKIWFSPAAKENKFVKKWAAELDEDKHPFPWDKEHAIVVKTHKPGDPKQPIFPLIKGESKEFPLPNFARHEGIKWTVGHLGVQIGSIVKTKSEKVNKFNQDVLDIFNLGAGNMLKEGNVLTWNVWFTAPELVVESEWQGHAELWRKSLTIDHVNPEGPGTKARFFDGTPFQPAKALFEDILEDQLPKILDFLKKRL